MQTRLHTKYGINNPFQLPSVKAKLNAMKDKIQCHRNATKKTNGTFKVSKKEDAAYEILCKKYGQDNVIRQYWSEAYPFNCDFYIKPLDLYIECNFSWTHGGHWFDENDEEDLKKLQQWKDKGTKYYLNAIDTWTVRDVKKKKIAEENRLNYVVFWKFNEVNSLMQ